MSVEEFQFVERAREGDVKAFEELVKMFQGRVRSFFASRLWDKTLVDDLSQDVFVVAFQKIATFDPSQPLYPWLKGIAHNLLRNEIKRRRDMVAQDAEGVLKALDAAASEQADNLEIRSGTLDMLDYVKDCKDRLEKTSRQIIDDHYTGGLSLAAISEQIGKSTKAIAVALVRIRRNLRECVERKAAGAARGVR